MRFILSLLLLGGLLLSSPARADAHMNPNSFYNGSHYVTGEEYAKPSRSYVRAKYHRGSHAKSSRGVRGKHAYRPARAGAARVAGKPKPAVVWNAAEFGKGWISVGGLIVDTAAFGGLTLAQVVVETATKIVSAFVIEPVKRTVSAAERVIRFFIDKGYPKPAAYAIAGHIRAESNFNTYDVGDGGRARYLAQWHPDRQAGLKRLAREKGVTPYDFDLNLEYIDHELRTSEQLAYRELHRARDIDDAVAAFAHFERPQGYSVQRPRRIRDWRTRLNFARQYAREYPHVEPVFIIGRN